MIATLDNNIGCNTLECELCIDTETIASHIFAMFLKLQYRAISLESISVIPRLYITLQFAILLRDSAMY